MLSLRSPSFSPLVRSLAVAAVLLVAGLQVLEAAHNHEPGDGAVHCVQCKYSPAAAVSQAPAAVAITLASGPLPRAGKTAAASRRPSQLRSRGPPAFS